MIPSFSRNKCLWKYSYFLASRSCFFHRFADTGFKTKWTGLWSRERKFLEYFAVKAGREWLSATNSRKLDYDFASSVHHYKTKSGDLKERLFIPEDSDSLVVVLEADKPLDFEIELAVNIRKRTENKTYRPYNIESSENGLAVKNELGTFMFMPLKGKFLFENRAFYKEHWPSGEEQNCLIPGRISMRGKEIVFSLSASEKPFSGSHSKALENKREYYSSLVKGIIKTDNKPLEKAFKSSVLAIELLTKNFQGKDCLYAGLPWFQQFWGRDLFWALPALIHLGYMKQARGCLEIFSNNEDGKVRNLFSETEGTLNNALDTTMLWIISLERYVSSSGDADFLRKLYPSLLKSLEYLFSRDMDNDGYLEHDQNESETWMDTLKRGPRAVDIQGLYMKSLEASKSLLSLQRNSLLKEVERRLSILEEKFRNDFFPNGKALDTLPDSRNRTSNALVPIALGVSENNQFMRKIESDFTTPKGVATMSLKNKGFAPSGYHSGMVWSLTTAWASGAEYLSGNPSKGREYLNTLITNTEEEALGCVSECWNSSDLSLSGCSLQLWGSAFIIRLVDEFMLGIMPDALTNTIQVSPTLPPETSFIEREIGFGKGKVKLCFRKKGRKTEVSCTDSGVQLIKQ